MIEIEIKKVGSSATPFHGGGFANLKYIIGIDETQPINVQRGVVIHEIIESYCRAWGHDSVEELTSLIVQALDKLEDK